MDTVYIYEPTDYKDPETGLFYKKWAIPKGMPVTSDKMITTAPPSDIKFPKYDWIEQKWKEDKDSIIESIKKENELKTQRLSELASQVDNLENALLESIDLILG